MGRAVNVGAGHDISIGDLAATLVDRIAPGTPIVTDEGRLRPPDSEVERLVADTTLMRELTGWQPRYSLEDGLAATIEWFADPANRTSYRLGYTT